MKPDMNHTIAQLKDNLFFADLLNGPCKPMREASDDETPGAKEAQPFIPVNPEWIDDEMSERLTNVFLSLIPEEMPFVSLVRVVKNPDTLLDGIAVDDGRKRTRYIVVTVVQDTEYPYDVNYPLIQTMGIVSLSAWEMTRATIAASKAFAKVMISEHPDPPILNNAAVEWVSLYVGREKFTGPSNLQAMAIADSGQSDDLDMDTHLYDVRSMDDPLARKLIDAVNEDIIPQKDQECKPKGN